MDGSHFPMTSTTGEPVSSGKKGKRRKVIKSCAFCRKRKLKCSQARPMCQQCVIRKLPQCVYTEEFNYPLSNTELFEQVPNVALVQKIENLQTLLKENDNNNAKPVYCRSSENPLRSLRTSVLGDNGSRYVFGPTSWKTLSLFEQNKFQTEFQNLWKVLKPLPECTKSQLNENDVVADLPSFPQMESCIKSFFAGPLFDILHIFNQDDILSLLDRLFIRDTTDKNLVILLDLQGNAKDKYNLGIVLQILCLGYYNQDIPSSVSHFLHTLSAASLSSSSSNFVEKLQFFLLSYISVMINCTDGVWDATQGVDLINELCQGCISLGLNDIDKWYSNESEETKQNLRCIWFWALFLDVSTSYDIGNPPSISDDLLDLSIFTAQNFQSPSIDFRRVKLMHDFLDVSRFTTREIHKREMNEKLTTFSLRLIEFIQSNFSPIEHYTNSVYYSDIDPFDILILSRSLSIVASIYNIEMIIAQQSRIIDKNRMVQFLLISISVCVNTMVFHFKEPINDQENVLTEGLKLSIILINPLLIRIVSQVYSLAFNRLIFREKGFLFLIDLDTGKKIQFIKYEEENFDELLTGFDVRTDKFLSFSGTIIRFYEIIDSIFAVNERNKRLLKAVSNFYQLTSTLAFERVSRVLFDKASQARIETEKIWLKKGINMEHFSDLMIEDFINDVWKTFKEISKDLWSIDKKKFYKQYHFDL
ncbi:BAF_collapsed_G0041460.mRNA.1.CDS.1 [Saccharomyces cerevisiae]|nr:BAF_collapsed_G0041460.mRNA.1.CDS.1 [Saccharomyces cerevisiae]